MLIENVTSHLKNHTHAYGALLGMILVVLGVFLYTNKINSISTAVTEQQVAQITYKPLTDLFTLGSLTSTADTVGYLQKMIFFVIGLAIVLAILMIVWGGIQYMASEAFTEKQDAVNRMTMALFGLIIALGAYLLLNIINPRLVVIDLEIKATRNVVGTPARPPAPAGIINIQGGPRATHADALGKLNAAGINVSSTGNCSDANNSRCTSLDGIKQTTLDALIAIKKDCESTAQQCPITVTGGTETGHAGGLQSHGNGDKLDIRFNQNDRVSTWITTAIQQVNRGAPPSLDTTYHTTLSTKTGENFLLEFRYEGNHWDIKNAVKF